MVTKETSGDRATPSFHVTKVPPLSPSPPNWRPQAQKGRSGQGGQGRYREQQREITAERNPPGNQNFNRFGLTFWPTAQMYNIAPGACFNCGDPSHRLYEDECYYKAAILQGVSCGQCGTGGHKRDQCCGPNQRAIQALREHMKNTAGRGQPPGVRGAGRPGRGARGDRGRRQVQKVAYTQFEEIEEDPFDDYLSGLENQDF